MMEDIKAFHEKFNLAYNGGIRFLDPDVAEFRVKFMLEELNEYIKAVEAGDIKGQMDALVDLVYVALGTAYLQGIPWNDAWKIVQNCNMAKVKAGPNGEGSKRGSPHDVIKPTGWKGPDYSELLITASKGPNN